MIAMQVAASSLIGWGGSISGVIDWFVHNPNHLFWYSQLAAEMVMVYVIAVCPLTPPWLSVYFLIDMATSVLLISVEHVSPHRYDLVWIPKQYLMMILLAIVVAEAVSRVDRIHVLAGLRWIGIIAIAAAVVMDAETADPSGINTLRAATMALDGLANIAIAFFLAGVLSQCARLDTNERNHAAILMVFTLLSGIQYLVASRYPDTIGRGLMIGNIVCFAAWAFLYRKKVR